MTRRGGECVLAGEGGTETVALPLEWQPEDYVAADFDLSEVTIGIHFHWERREDQKFKGTLRIIDEGEHLTAVNVLPLEEYLLSVISSEMKATSNLELLKAHAVISRSWLLAQKAKAARVEKGAYCSCRETEEEMEEEEEDVGEQSSPPPPSEHRTKRRHKPATPPAPLAAPSAPPAPPVAPSAWSVKRHEDAAAEPTDQPSKVAKPSGPKPRKALPRMRIAVPVASA